MSNSHVGLQNTSPSAHWGYVVLKQSPNARGHQSATLALALTPNKLGEEGLKICLFSQ